MSEPIRTVEELVEACKDLTLSSWDVLALKHPNDTELDDPDLGHALSVVPDNAHHANRILDYLGIDSCLDGETPRERIAALEANRDDAVAMLGTLDAHRIRLNVELDRYRAALVRVLRWSTEKNGDLGGAAWWIQGAVRECCAAAGLDPDTLGVE